MVLKFLKTKKIIIILIVLLAFVARIGNVIMHPIPVRDSYIYQKIINDWGENSEYSSNIPPLGLYMMTLPRKLFGLDTIKSGVSVNMLLGICSVLMITAIAHRIVNSFIIEVGVGVIAATHPTLVHYSCHVLRDNTYIMCLLLLVIEIVEYINKERIRDMVLSGMISAFALASRYEGFEAIIIVCLIVLMKKSRKQKRLRDLIIYVSTVIVTINILFMLIGVTLNERFIIEKIKEMTII